MKSFPLKSTNLMRDSCVMYSYIFTLKGYWSPKERFPMECYKTSITLTSFSHSSFSADVIYE